MDAADRRLVDASQIARLNGLTARLDWHYYPAADIYGYAVRRSKDRRQWTLSAVVVYANAFNLTQRPLTFVAVHAKGEWRWPVVDLTLIDGHALTARLGPPEAIIR